MNSEPRPESLDDKLSAQEELGSQAPASKAYRDAMKFITTEAARRPLDVHPQGTDFAADELAAAKEVPSDIEAARQRIREVRGLNPAEIRAQEVRKERDLRAGPGRP